MSPRGPLDAGGADARFWVPTRPLSKQRQRVRTPALAARSAFGGATPGGHPAHVRGAREAARQTATRPVCAEHSARWAHGYGHVVIEPIVVEPQEPELWVQGSSPGLPQNTGELLEFIMNM